MIKAVFMDCDYTLYSHDRKCFVPSAVEAIRKAKEKGILCIMATGRCERELSIFPTLNDIGLDGYILMNGGLALDKDRNVIFEHFFDPDTQKQLDDLFESNTIPMQLIEKDDIYINYTDEKVRKALGNLAVLDFKIGKCTYNPLYLAVTFISREEEKDFLRKIPNCTVQRWSNFGVDIVPKGTDKASGIMQYIEKLGITKDQCMAIGDSFNDIGMLKKAGIGVAMGNAEPEVKQVATYITTDIDDDGIYNAFVHYNLI